MSTSCKHNHNFDGASKSYKNSLWVVIVLNAAMFVVEMTSGHIAGSQALQADALDFLGDTVTYAISLAVIGKSIQARANVALLKGISLLFMGVWVFASALYQVINLDVPRADIMGGIGLLAFAVNVICVLILLRYKNGDANVRSVWLCSRNDAIGNIAVVVAALSVWNTSSAWPDLIVAAVMALLFISSSVSIIRHATRQRTQTINIE